MRIVPLVLLAGIACRYDLDHAKPDAAVDPNARLCTVSDNVQSCLDAADHSDFSYVQSQILAPKCTLSACHDGAPQNPAGYLDFTSLGSAYTSLVNVQSHVDKTRMLVVAGNPAQSFLTVMLGQIKPADADPPLTGGVPIVNPNDGQVVGTMPQGNPLLCCQKLDAIAAWIAAGAPPQ